MTISVAPEMLNTFKMPLVDNNNNSLGFRLINLFEEIFISLINKDLLESWEEDGGALNIPIDQMLIKALLSEGSRTCLSNLLSVTSELFRVG